MRFRFALSTVQLGRRMSVLYPRELQKTYRVCEQLFRVQPVVLVAQEVPSPDQITEAWVISNDWILNRCLLDDSFRPTLRYLANKSVGDDFCLRELRKRHDLTQEQMAIRTGKERASVANFLRLLRLPEPIQHKVESGDLPFGHARTLLALDSAESISAAAQKVVRLSMSESSRVLFCTRKRKRRRASEN